METDLFADDTLDGPSPPAVFKFLVQSLVIIGTQKLTTCCSGHRIRINNGTFLLLPQQEGSRFKSPGEQCFSVSSLYVLHVFVLAQR